MNTVEGVHPVVQVSELATLFQARQIDQQVKSRSLMRPKSPFIRQQLQRVLAHDPAELPGLPCGMVQKPADGCR
ncbi:hypothetical protein M1R55_03045 [Deinococcus sp. QL22]|nr:hypothetical protein [Deinococcus sp. QL22]UQN06908.1 hypothetical protein M1R55_03045 [Deinococcus sp. QL22]